MRRMHFLVHQVLGELAVDTDFHILLVVAVGLEEVVILVEALSRRAVVPDDVTEET